jgi:hypothetical protein
MECSVCEERFHDYCWADPCDHAYCRPCFDEHYDECGWECPTCEEAIDVLHSSDGDSEYAADDQQVDSEDNDHSSMDSFIEDDSEAANKPKLKKYKKE